MIKIAVVERPDVPRLCVRGTLLHFCDLRGRQGFLSDSVRISYFRRIARQSISQETLYLFEENDVGPELLYERILIEGGISTGEETRDLGKFLLQEGEQANGIAVTDDE
jgi:hypothetical protein